MFASVFGTGRFVIEQGDDFAAVLESANSLLIKTGACFFDGRYFRITAAETLSLDSGAQGVNRCDLAGFKYSYNSGTGVETMVPYVVKGTATSGTPSDPTYTDGNILAGATDAFWPLYRITWTGISNSISDVLFKPVKHTAMCPFPIGSVLQLTSSTDPNDEYPGTTWSKINGVFLLGSSSGHALGTTGGAETLTLTEAQLPSHAHSVGAHSHGLNNHVHTIGAHSHGLNSHAHSYAKPNSPTGSTALTINQIPSHSHKTATGAYNVAEGSGATVWKTNPGVENFYTQNTGGGQGHTHTIGTTSTNTGAASGSTANSGAFDSGAASGSTANSAAFNTGAVGSGSSIDKMPPFKVVAMWERTA